MLIYVPRVLVICLFIVSLQKDYPNLFVFFDNLKFNGGAFSGVAFFIKFVMLIKKCVRTFCAFWRINVQFAGRKAYFSTLDKFFSEITTELFPYMSHLWTQKKTGAFTYKTNKT